MVLEHRRTLVGYASRLAGPAVGDDVAQEVLASWWQRPGDFDPSRGSVRPFLMMRCRGYAIDRVRADASRRAREQRRLRLEPAPVAPGPEEAVLDAEGARWVQAGVSALPSREREAIVLAFWGDHTYREVSSMLGVAEGTVKSRVRSGLRRLRDELDGDGRARPVRPATAPRPGGRQPPSPGPPS